MKKLTLQDKMNVVMNNDNMREAYNEELNNRRLKYSKHGSKKGNKKISIQRLMNEQKYVAQFIYDNFHAK